MIRIATRASALALWQAERVKRLLEDRGERVSIVRVRTQGDRDLRPLSQLSGSGFFTKAVQDAVSSGVADVAVHSYKDLPSDRPAGLVVAAVPERADPRDMLVVRRAAYDPAAGSVPLTVRARVGTSSARRRAQLEMHRADLVLEELRGNVPTRVGMVRSGQLDAVLIAKAGVDRLELDLEGLVGVPLSPLVVMPAPAQGALAVETTEELARRVSRIDDHAVALPVTAERELMTLFDAGCQLELGALATAVDSGLELMAWYAGSTVRVSAKGAAEAARAAFEELGPRVVRGALR